MKNEKMKNLTVARKILKGDLIGCVIFIIVLFYLSVVSPAKISFMPWGIVAIGAALFVWFIYLPINKALKSELGSS